MSVDSLDCPGEEDDPFSPRGGEKRNLATRKERLALAEPAE